MLLYGGTETLSSAGDLNVLSKSRCDGTCLFDFCIAESSEEEVQESSAFDLKVLRLNVRKKRDK